MTQLFNIDIQKEDQKQISWNRKKFVCGTKNSVLTGWSFSERKISFSDLLS